MSSGHPRALSMIEAEIEYFVQHVGEDHASAGASACIELAYLLRQIDAGEYASFKAQVLRIYKCHWEVTA